jgi:hypothetical protein
MIIRKNKEESDMYILLLHAGYLMPFASATSSGWLCHGMRVGEKYYTATTKLNHQMTYK